MNDVLLGTPSLVTLESSVGAINPNAVNIMTTGHQSALQHALMSHQAMRRGEGCWR